DIFHFLDELRDGNTGKTVLLKIVLHPLPEGFLSCQFPKYMQGPGPFLVNGEGSGSQGHDSFSFSFVTSIFQLFCDGEESPVVVIITKDLAFRQEGVVGSKTFL